MCSTAAALILTGVVGVSRRTPGRSGASVFVVVSDSAIAACVAALADAIRLADTVMYTAKRDGGRCIYSRL